jgi:hypothetical protein
MTNSRAAFTTGIPGLDKVLHGIEPGDNIVWEVDDIEEYGELIVPYVEASKAAGRHLIYFRFAPHPSLVPDSAGAEIHNVDPAGGFENFVRDVHAVIERAGRGAVYVFDCLSHLADVWKADQSLGNFFMLTCPRLFDLETVTYFGLFRDKHSSYALDPIRSTTQFMLDLFRLDERLYVRPIKVQHRSREAMNTIHVRQGDAFLPVKESAVLAQILSRTQWPRLQSDRRSGYWRKLFAEARSCPTSSRPALHPRALRCMLARFAGHARPPLGIARSSRSI